MKISHGAEERNDVTRTEANVLMKHTLKERTTVFALNYVRGAEDAKLQICGYERVHESIT